MAFWLFVLVLNITNKNKKINHEKLDFLQIIYWMIFITEQNMIRIIM